MMTELRAGTLEYSAGAAHVLPKAGQKWLLPVALALGVCLAGAGGSATAADGERLAAAAFEPDAALVRGPQQNGRFGRPLWMQSEAGDGTATGVINAGLGFPFTTARSVLSEPASWCDILMLHFNVKSCQPIRRGEEVVLDVGIGRKFEASAGNVYHISFRFTVAQTSEKALHVELLAEEGPLSTRNYRISVLSVPSADGGFVMRLSYAYEYGLVGQLAMQVYLRTLGRGKVGFSIEGEDHAGRVRYVGGMRGAVERNAMRYYLAIESFMRSLSSPPQQQVEVRLQDWFTSVERYAHQLREMDRDTYLAIKRKELARQRQAGLAGEES